MAAGKRAKLIERGTGSNANFKSQFTNAEGKRSKFSLYTRDRALAIDLCWEITELMRNRTEGISKKAKEIYFGEVSEDSVVRSNILYEIRQLLEKQKQYNEYTDKKIAELRKQLPGDDQ